jgi:transposase
MPCGDPKTAPSSRRLDAATLSRMGAMLKLKARPKRCLNSRSFTWLASPAERPRRRQQPRQDSDRANVETSAIALERIKRHVAAIEAEILMQVEADPDLAQRFAILTSIPGRSAIAAFALLIEMPELGA